MSSPNQPSQGIVFEVAVDASDLIENDPDVLRAVDDLLSTPISENFREDALDAVADVQLSCEADFQRYCVSSSTPTVSSVNIDDFLLSFGSFGPVEMEWARRRLKKASKSQSQLKTSSSFLNEIKRRILQAPLDLPAPHSGAHVGISPSSTSSTPLKLTKEQRKELTNKLNKLHKTGKTDKNKSMKLASKERQRRLQFKHESYHFSGGPSSTCMILIFRELYLYSIAISVHIYWYIRQLALMFFYLYCKPYILIIFFKHHTNITPQTSQTSQQKILQHPYLTYFSAHPLTVLVVVTSMV